MPRGGTRAEPAYEMTRDGFTLLAMGFTGKTALAFKVRYIEEFNRMEAALRAPVQPVLPNFTDPIMNTLELVIDLPFLAREINDAHRQVQFHGKSILMEAIRAGENLAKAKRDVEHGGFAAWVTANCEFSYRTAKRYMLVSKKAKLGPFDPGKSVDAFLKSFVEEAAEPEPPSTPRQFTREDAERALKLHALAERGATEHEQAAASGKLAVFAKEFGMTPEAVIAKAREFDSRNSREW